jgi:hypothetical protein
MELCIDPCIIVAKAQDEEIGVFENIYETKEHKRSRMCSEWVLDELVSGFRDCVSC